jgi:carbon monoxide dehydrogenase subunit G
MCPVKSTSPVRAFPVGLNRERFNPTGNRCSHNNAAVQAFPEGNGSRVVWMIDLLPNDLAPAVGGMMDAAAKVMAKTLASQLASSV